MGSAIAIDEDLERGALVTPEENQTSSSSTFAPALVLIASKKRIDEAGKKKYVKLDEINSEMVGTLSRADFDTEVAKIRASSTVDEVNELGETALYRAAEMGHLEVVKELLKYSDQETLTRKTYLEYDY